MNTHSVFVEREHEESDYNTFMPDIERVAAAPADAGPDWQSRKRREALQILSKCCDLWEDADRCGLFAVRDKMEPVIMHAHDAFVRFQLRPKA